MTPSYLRTSIVDVGDPRINGLKYAYYEGKWNALPDFSKLKPRKNGFRRGI